MNNREAIEILKPLFEQCKGINGCLGHIEHFFTKQEEVALDVAVKALEIVDIPHIRDYIIINTQKIYLTQGHIDALLEYERKQLQEKIVKDFMRSLEEM